VCTIFASIWRSYDQGLIRIQELNPSFTLLRLTNDGSIQIVEGTLDIQGTDFANNGDIQIEGGTLILRSASGTSAGNITGAGEVHFLANSIDIDGLYDVTTTTITGSVGPEDYDVWKSNFGLSAGAANTAAKNAAMSEPPGVVLLLLGAASLFRGGRSSAP